MRTTSDTNAPVKQGDQFFVSLGRRMNGAKDASELFGVYGSKQEADRAVADIKKWAAQIRASNAQFGVTQSDWDITKIEVDRLGKGNTVSTAAAPRPNNPPVATPSATPKPSSSFPSKKELESALSAQREMLLSKKSELLRWDDKAKGNFKLWFNTTDDAARNLILKRIDQVLDLNRQYTASNFLPALQSKPNRYAYVHGNDPSHIHLDALYSRAPLKGTASQAGTLTHEMSHFLGTKDISYGEIPSRVTALLRPESALNNADNFEFYVEGAPVIPNPVPPTPRPTPRPSNRLP